MSVVLPPLIWRPSPNVSSRHGERIDLLVLHETAGSYKGSVSWLCNPDAEASAHAVLREDGLEATQLVRYGEKAWTQAAFNPRCVSLELANITPKGYATEQQLRVAARIFGFWLLKFKLPYRFARGGQGRGFCRHLDLGQAGGGHTQCGPGWEAFSRFGHYLGDELERGGYRKTWGRD